MLSQIGALVTPIHLCVGECPQAEFFFTFLRMGAIVYVDTVILLRHSLASFTLSLQYAAHELLYFRTPFA